MTCIREAPAVAEVQEKYGDQVAFYGVAGRDGIDPIRRFIDSRGVDAFPHIVDESGNIWDQMGVVSQPAFIFVDDTGEASSHLGGLGVDSLSERLDELTSN